MLRAGFMKAFLKLGKYSLGVGDRFAHQATAQLQAGIRAVQRSVEITPVWNKSNREHTLIGCEPVCTRASAAAEVICLSSIMDRCPSTNNL